jgi:HlyD family secretion protein
MSTRARRWAWIVGLVVLAGGIGAGYRLIAPAAAASAQGDAPLVPTALVVRGPLDLNVHVTGELRAAKASMLVAPSVGGTLRILKLLPTGTPVKAGDVIAEFDPTEQQYALEQSRSELQEAEQQIVKRKADLEVQAAENEVTLLGARFDVRRAELDSVMDQDLISANDYKKRQLALDEAKRRLAQLEADTTSRAETSRAALMLVEERRAKAELAATRAQQNIEGLALKAAIDGVVVVRANNDAAGGFFYSGMSLPDYRAGDNTFAGRPLADVFDVTGMELRIKVSEQHRANVAVGQVATIVSSGLPGVEVAGTVLTVAGLVGSNDWWSSGGPVRQFDATLKLDRVDPRLRPGTSVEAVLKGKRVEGVLQVPLQAVRQKAGKPVVFVQGASGFEARDVKILYRTESRAGLEGLDEGAVVALVDPTAAAAPSTGATPAAGAAGVVK